MCPGRSTLTNTRTQPPEPLIFPSPTAGHESQDVPSGWLKTWRKLVVQTTGKPDEDVVWSLLIQQFALLVTGNDQQGKTTVQVSTSSVTKVDAGKSLDAGKPPRHSELQNVPSVYPCALQPVFLREVSKKNRSGRLEFITKIRHEWTMLHQIIHHGSTPSPWWTNHSGTDSSPLTIKKHHFPPLVINYSP